MSIITCLYLPSRAVYLQMAQSLGTDACINALLRFISQRSQVSHMQLEKGTNFVGAEEELREVLAYFNRHQIQAVLHDGIHGSFNLPTGSHYSGVWECINLMVMVSLYLQTLDDGLNHNDLTPNHILLMKGKPALPPGLLKKRHLYMIKRWRQGQYIADLVWKRRVQEDLPLLQEWQKWNVLFMETVTLYLLVQRYTATKLFLQGVKSFYIWQSNCEVRQTRLCLARGQSVFTCCNSLLAQGRYWYSSPLVACRFIDLSRHYTHH